MDILRSAFIQVQYGLGPDDLARIDSILWQIRCATNRLNEAPLESMLAEIASRYEGPDRTNALKLIDEATPEYVRRAKSSRCNIGSIPNLAVSEESAYNESGKLVLTGLKQRIEEDFLGIDDQSESVSEGSSAISRSDRQYHGWFNSWND